MWRGTISNSVRQTVASVLFLTLSLSQAYATQVRHSETTPEQQQRQRIERFIQTAWNVGLELGFEISTMAQFENRIRKAGEWASERQLPLPTGFSIFADAGAGFMIGARAGAEIVFLIPEEGEVQMGLFTALDTEFGAEVMLGAGTGINLIFNMENLKDLAGPVIGVNAEVKMVEGAGASLTVDVEPSEIRKAKDTFMAFVRADDNRVLAEMYKLIRQKRLFAVGAQYEWGLGAEIGVALGWRAHIASTSLPVDPELLPARLTEFKQLIREKFSKREPLKFDRGALQPIPVAM
jgi:hypothetical protein